MMPRWPALKVLVLIAGLTLAGLAAAEARAQGPKPGQVFVYSFSVEMAGFKGSERVYNVMLPVRPADGAGIGVRYVEVRRPVDGQSPPSVAELLAYNLLVPVKETKGTLVTTFTGHKPPPAEVGALVAGSAADKPITIAFEVLENGSRVAEVEREMRLDRSGKLWKLVGSGRTRQATGMVIETEQTTEYDPAVLWPAGSTWKGRLGTQAQALERSFALKDEAQSLFFVACAVTLSSAQGIEPCQCLTEKADKALVDGMAPKVQEMIAKGSPSGIISEWRKAKIDLGASGCSS